MCRWANREDFGVEIWIDLATFLDHILNSGVASIRPYFKFLYQSIINNELRQVHTVARWL